MPHTPRSCTTDSMKNGQSYEALFGSATKPSRSRDGYMVRNGLLGELDIGENVLDKVVAKNSNSLACFGGMVKRLGSRISGGVSSLEAEVCLINTKASSRIEVRSPAEWSCGVRLSSPLNWLRCLLSKGSRDHVIDSDALL